MHILVILYIWFIFVLVIRSSLVDEIDVIGRLRQIDVIGCYDRLLREVFVTG
jgi:hypothetical protein